MNWIKVTDRVPDGEGEVLCLLRSDDNTEFHRILCYDSDIGDFWWGSNDDEEYTNVTHWMPLPEPPKD